ncbi:Flp pilus assembly complex ATPase component TadA [Candidatus Dojkabacteria bacterium]|nr:Flp pilus assembly complex ATPase component TadA [Candidatus Dojkabacteria bacterium]
MVIDNTKLKQILAKYKVASEKQIQGALKEAQKTGNGVDQVLIEKKILTKDDIAEAIAKEYEVPYTNLSKNTPSEEQLLKIPVSVAKQYYVVLISDSPQKAVFATDDPTQEGLKAKLKEVYKDQEIVLTYSLPQDIEKVLESLTEAGKPVDTDKAGTKNRGFFQRLFKGTKADKGKIKSKKKVESIEINNEKLKEILQKGKYVGESELAKAFIESEETDQPLSQRLIELGLISKDIIGQAIAEEFKVPYADLNTNPPGTQQILRIPKEIATTLYTILYKEDTNTVTVATDNPSQPNLKQKLRDIFPNKSIVINYSLSSDIERLLINYREDLTKRLKDAQEKGDRPAITMLKDIMDEAITLKASDIHLEPEDDYVVIRFRIDGVMQEFGKLEYSFFPNILNRIKILSKLRIDEHLKSQDGSMSFGEEEKEVNIRVSIVPTLNGEKVVMRLLAKYVEGFALSDIGLGSANEEILTRASKKPFGMLLVTGPTGSGKTTTLYSVLKLLNKRDVNITTIEDPVEYRIKGVNQIQVNTETGLTFAKGLRSIVRQDPDIILVGEIRDEETAEISVNAALTGHLMLSTFHANDAATAIPRLLDMNIESFLLSSTLEVVIAQRLIRKICNKCKTSYEMSATEVKNHPGLGKGKMTLYKGTGCSACNNSGYLGRTAIFEIIEVNKEMKDLILTNPSSQEVWELAKKQGSKSLYEDGIEKIKAGITTIEELSRVASPSEL